MVSAISSNQVINGYFPKVNEAITKFIDALVSLKVDPEAEFSRKINTYVQEMNDRYTDGFEIFNNRDLLKNLSFPALVKLAILSFADPTHGSYENPFSPSQSTLEQIKDKLYEYMNNPTAKARIF